MVAAAADAGAPRMASPTTAASRFRPVKIRKPNA
jgi:hypothetical protein